MRLSLSSKIRLLLASLLICFGVAALSTFQILSSRQVDRIIKSDVASASRQLTTVLNDRAEQLRAITTYAATAAPRVRGLIFSSDSATVEDQLPNVAKEFGLDAVEFFDADGRLLGQYGLPSHMQFTGDAGTARTALDLESAPTADQTGTVLYLAAARAVTLDKSIRGSIRFLKKFGSREAKDLAQGSGADLAFVLNGKVVACSLNGPPKNVSSEGIPTEVSIGDEQFVEFLAPLRLTDSQQQIQLLTLKNLSAMTQPYRQAQTVFTVVLLLCLVAAIGLGHQFGKGLVQPLDVIVKAANQVQNGTWPEPIPTDRKDEIGVLQTAFNEMVASAKSAQERLFALIDRDPLTEFSNHRRFRERLAQQLDQCSAVRQAMGLVLIDIDRFGRLNHEFGHAAGDKCLTDIAAIVRQASPDGALIGRYGNDCFAVGLVGANSQTSASFAAEIQSRLAASGSSVTVSIGNAEFPRNSQKAEGLVLAAELALARAKQLGFSQTSNFDDVPGAHDSDPFQLHRFLEDGSLATIQALAAAVDAKDAYTNGHSERVARYASDLATFHGLDPEEVDRVFRCGTLHDVGKIGVPDAILQKPGRLDAEEVRVMETHPVLGEMIVAKVPQLADLLAGVRHHHERWDGQGYPDGLAGESIPEIARILALADTFDAMTSDRPYRKGMDVNVALNEIERCAGLQFDPKLAPEFVRMMRTNSISSAA